MRFSVIKGDPGYDETHSRRVKSVSCDGIELEGCVTADEDQGYALTITPDGNGGFLQDPVSGDFTLTHHTGKVIVTLMPKGERDWDPTRKGQAKVRLGLEGRDLLVQVYSNARPGAIRQMRIVRADLETQSSLCSKAGAVAGAAAEHLCDQFGDRMDPSAVAAEAVRLCAEALLRSGKR